MGHGSQLEYSVVPARLNVPSAAQAARIACTSAWAGRVVLGRHAVHPGRDDDTVADDDGPEGSAAGGDVLDRQPDGEVEVVRVGPLGLQLHGAHRSHASGAAGAVSSATTAWMRP